MYWTHSTLQTVDLKSHTWKSLTSPTLIPPLERVVCQSNAIGITALAALARMLLARADISSIRQFDFRGNHFTFRGMELFGTILVQQNAAMEVLCNFVDIVDDVTGDAVVPSIVGHVPLDDDVMFTYLLCLKMSCRIVLPPEIHRQVFSFLKIPLWRRIRLISA